MSETVKSLTLVGMGFGGICLDIRINDILQMKKKHPCGSADFTVLRVGMDFKLRCNGCGHEVMLPRSKAEKNIKKVLQTGENKVV